MTNDFLVYKNSFFDQSLTSSHTSLDMGRCRIYS